MQLNCGAGEIQCGHAFGNHCRIAGKCIILRLGGQCALFEPLHRLHDELRAERGQAVMQLVGSLVFTDFERPFQEHIAGVESLCHLHDGHASLLLTVEDDTLNRRGTAVFREQGRMDVDAAVLRQIEHGFRQDLTVGSNDDAVRCHCLEIGKCLFGILALAE